MDKYYTIGKSLGYSGQDLLQFAQQSLKADDERDSRIHERELAKIKIDQVSRDLERAHEMSLKDKELEKARIQAECSNNSSQLQSPSSDLANHGANPLHMAIRTPQMSTFNPDQDDMDSFLIRFERYCKANNWNSEYWASILSNLLTGPALEVYSSMPETDIDDYAALKKALQKRYMLTADSFHQKFRSAQPNHAESSLQYLTRLKNYLEKWIDLSVTEKSYEGLTELFVVEQFLNTCSNQIAVHLKELGVGKIQDIAEYADQYVAAHKFSSLCKPSAPKIFDRHSDEKQHSNDTASIKEEPNFSRNPKNEQNRTETRHNNFCKYCKKNGHLVKDCRILQARKSVNVGVKHSSSQLETIPGKVNGKKVKILCDTGCNTVLVSPRLVKPHQFIRKFSKVRCYCRNGVRVQEAKVNLQCKQRSGMVKCYVPCDIIPEYDVVYGIPQAFQCQGYKPECNAVEKKISARIPRMSKPVRRTAALNAIHKMLEGHRKWKRFFPRPARRQQSPVGHVQSGASRYKTELCRPFTEAGQCKFSDKCHFAHGPNELRSRFRHPKYKTELCRTFHTTGLCCYGTRCHFIHNEDECGTPASPVGSPPPSMPSPSSNDSLNPLQKELRTDRTIYPDP